MKKLLLVVVFCLSYGELYDPTQPAGYEAEDTLGDIDFSMAFASDDNKVAIINGNSYHEGDSINGNKIIEIATNKVVLQNPRGNGTTEITTHSSVKRSD